MFQTECEAAVVVPQAPQSHGVWYDSERIVLTGSYADQVTAYRARRRWMRTLESHFLLDCQHDFRLSVHMGPGHNGHAQTGAGDSYGVTCEFTSACGRYAFWRLTHHQAPEVQFLLENAHLPSVGAMPAHFASVLDGEAMYDSYSLGRRGPLIGGRVLGSLLSVRGVLSVIHEGRARVGEFSARILRHLTGRIGGRD